MRLMLSSALAMAMLITTTLAAAAQTAAQSSGTAGLAPAPGSSSTTGIGPTPAPVPNQSLNPGNTSQLGLSGILPRGSSTTGAASNEPGDDPLHPGFPRKAGR